MSKNPILEEIRSVRESLLAEAGGTLDGLVDRLQAEERQSDRARYRRRTTPQDDGPIHEDELPVGSHPVVREDQ